MSTSLIRQRFRLKVFFTRFVLPTNVYGGFELQNDKALPRFKLFNVIILLEFLKWVQFSWLSQRFFKVLKNTSYSQLLFDSQIAVSGKRSSSKKNGNVSNISSELEQLTLEFPGDLVTFTEEILNRKLHFLCSVKYLASFYPQFV